MDGLAGWPICLERGPSFPLALEWEEGPVLLPCLVLSCPGQEMVLSLSSTEWITTSSWDRAQACPGLDLGMVIGAEHWSVCHPCLTWYNSPSVPPPASGLLPEIETQRGIRSVASSTPVRCLLSSMTLSLNTTVGEGKGRGVTEPVLPGLKVGGRGAETQTQSPELLQARLDLLTLLCSCLPAFLFKRPFGRW